MKLRKGDIERKWIVRFEALKFGRMESAATKLQKESKGYLDSLRGEILLVLFPAVLTCSLAMTAAQTRIAETIDTFYGEAGQSDNVSAYYRQSVEDIDDQTVKELVLNLQT